jgi:hypothetical protein
LHWRRIFALAVYTYARAGELEALTWPDIDLVHGIIHIHSAADRETGTKRETKTGITRRVPIEPELFPLLKAMRTETAGRGRVIPHMPSRELGASTLRAGLRLAQVTRAELFANDATRKNITFHDLRATGITWCAIRGDDPLKIQRRAGHTDFATTQEYIREAENVRAGFGTVFAPLPPGVLGLAPFLAPLVSTEIKSTAEKAMKPLRPQPDSNQLHSGHQETGDDFSSTYVSEPGQFSTQSGRLAPQSAPLGAVPREAPEAFDHSLSVNKDRS